MTNKLAIRGFNDIQSIATAMAQSGFFANTGDVTKAMTKILAGHELGIGAFASMTGIHVIKGKLTLGANLVATLIKNDPRYDYKIVYLTNDGCEIAFFENGEHVGNSEFTRDDAVQAGVANKDNWRNYPRNMMFARAITNGARWFTAGVFGGAPVYTPEELGAEIDHEDNIIDIDVTVIDQVKEYVEQENKQKQEEIDEFENIVQLISIFSGQPDFVPSPPAIQARLKEAKRDVDMGTVVRAMGIWKDRELKGE